MRAGTRRYESSTTAIVSPLDSLCMRSNGLPRTSAKGQPAHMTVGRDRKLKTNDADELIIDWHQAAHLPI